MAVFKKCIEISRSEIIQHRPLSLRSARLTQQVLKLGL